MYTNLCNPITPRPPDTSYFPRLHTTAPQTWACALLFFNSIDATPRESQQCRPRRCRSPAWSWGLRAYSIAFPDTSPLALRAVVEGHPPPCPVVHEAGAGRRGTYQHNPLSHDNVCINPLSFTSWVNYHVVFVSRDAFLRFHCSFYPVSAVANCQNNKDERRRPLCDDRALQLSSS